MTHSEELKYWYDFIDGDINALSHLFEHYVDGLIAYGLKIYPDEELVKDSVQEVFVQLILKRQKLNRREEIRGLVFRMVRNKIIDEIKLINRVKRNNNLIGNAIVPFVRDAEYQYINAEENLKRNTSLSIALDQLSAHQKESMYLKYAQCHTYDQISEVMGISVASARTLIYRTLKQLKALMPKT